MMKKIVSEFAFKEGFDSMIIWKNKYSELILSTEFLKI